MSSKRKRIDSKKQVEILARVRRERATRQAGYREQALAMYPHVCGRCGRELEGKRLRELTVHHKDDDPMNNPPDGSNWELLCLYCHDDEHGGQQAKGSYSGYSSGPSEESTLTANPFEALKDMLGTNEDDAG